jgi:hypothetical protein
MKFNAYFWQSYESFRNISATMCYVADKNISRVPDEERVLSACLLYVTSRTFVHEVWRLKRWPWKVNIFSNLTSYSPVNFPDVSEKNITLLFRKKETAVRVYSWTVKMGAAYSSDTLVHSVTSQTATLFMQTAERTWTPTWLYNWARQVLILSDGTDYAVNTLAAAPPTWPNQTSPIPCTIDNIFQALENLRFYYINTVEGIAQSKKRRATDWTTGVRFPGGARFFCFPQHSERLWGPPSFLPYKYQGPFPRGVKR